MQNGVRIELSENDFNHIRALFPREAADKLEREKLAVEIARFWKWVHDHVREFGEVVAVDHRNKRKGVVASTFVLGAKDLAAYAIEAFKKACEFLRKKYVIAVRYRNGITAKFHLAWMEPFGVSV